MNLFVLVLLLSLEVLQLQAADPPLLPLGNGFSIATQENGASEISYFELIDKPIYSGGYLVNETHISIQRNATAYPEPPNATLKNVNWTIYWDTLRGTTPDLYVLRGGSYTLPPRSTLATMLINRLTTNQKTYTSLTFYGSTSNWSSIMFGTLVKTKLKIHSLNLAGFSTPFKLSEKQLINAIKTFKPTNVTISSPFQLPTLSNNFFNLAAVRNFTLLDTTGVGKSEINDTVLLNLKATVLRLGRAPSLTLTGIQKFFLRLLNGNVASGVLGIAIQNVTFNVDGNALFKGVNGVSAVNVSAAGAATLWNITKGSQVFYLQVYLNTYTPAQPVTTLTLCKKAVCNPSWFS